MVLCAQRRAAERIGQTDRTHLQEERHEMRKTLFWGLGLIAAMTSVAIAQDATHDGHVMSAPKDLKWGAAPPVFEKGATMAVVSGDPGKEGLYVVRLKMPAGYRINPHWHPTDEHVTVISGTFALGMGEKFEAASMTELPQGGYALLPAEMKHYAMAKTAAIVQVHGMGPFKLTYVNPADDPMQRSAKQQ
jgi:quercetin dioxygenase-like cupin family protein